MKRQQHENIPNPTYTKDKDIAALLQSSGDEVPWLTKPDAWDMHEQHPYPKVMNGMHDSYELDYCVNYL